MRIFFSFYQTINKRYENINFQFIYRTEPNDSNASDCKIKKYDVNLSLTK